MAQIVKEIANLMEDRIEYYEKIKIEERRKFEVPYLRKDNSFKELVVAEAVLEMLEHLYNTSINIIFDIEDEIEAKERKQKNVERNVVEDQHTSFDYVTYIRYEAQLDELYRLRSHIKNLYDFDL
ncbi:hypothetical protein PHRODO_25 [Bacillus phage Phrodo]|uniref:Uncharacterized protein n=1 Tax=Bacillus phage Jabberwock TaxID=3163548 RepID=A0AAU8EFD1_9CAUD|nr:hypothetical protein BI003_gp025 [Bacillus phage Phrodo]AMW62073.1 hypothetical protein PHRODO_25 [Bacillus phage Phrodo]UGO48840.1 hypothetical protein JARJAR_26 [Bacillus phage vB_BanH_JarJar]UGO50331.1 hypothetical protein RONSWANSON_25 [Bacillus phage vB_BanH_RonSwanson]